MFLYKNHSKVSLKPAFPMHTSYAMRTSKAKHTSYIRVTWWIWLLIPGFLGLSAGCNLDETTKDRDVITSSITISSNDPYHLPEIPTDVLATDGVVTDKVTITWQPDMYATLYRVYRAKSENAAYLKIGEVSGTTFDDTLLIVGKKLFYKVSSVNSQGESELSDPDSGYAGTLTTEVAPDPDALEADPGDDSISTAQAIAVGDLLPHTLDSELDEDWLVFEATAGQAFRIETASSGNNKDADTRFYLYDSNGNIIEETDDISTSNFFSLLIWECLATGTYYLKIVGVEGSLGEYSVRMRTTYIVEGDDYEADNTYENATLLELGTVQTHTIHISSDSDWIYFPAALGEEYTIETFAAGNDKNVDTKIALYSLSGTAIVPKLGDDNGGILPFSKLSWECDLEGDHYVYIYSMNEEMGEYNIKVYVGTGDSYESDDTLDSAKPFVAGSPQTHTLHSALDEDWIAFEATLGNRYSIEISEGADSLDLDTYLYLCDAGATVLDQDDDSGTGSFSLLADWYCPVSGTYYVQIKSLSGEKGEYVFSVSEKVGDSYESDNNASSATSIYLVAPQVHSIHESTDTDWLSFGAVSGVQYSIHTFVNAADQDADTFVTLYDTDGTTLLTSDDNGNPPTYSLISNWNCTVDGTYYIEVKSTNATVGGYKIRITASTGDLYEPDNSDAAAVAIALNILQTHSLHNSSDEDWFSFAAETKSNYVYTFRTYSAETGLDVDTLLELYDTDGTTLLTSDDDGDGNLYSKIPAWLCPVSGTYSLKVYGKAGAIGDYNIKISEDGGDSYESDNLATEANTLGIGSSQTHSIHTTVDEDWIQFSAHAEYGYTISTLSVFDGEPLDTNITLIDNTQTVLASNDDFDTDTYSKILGWHCETTGTYLVKIKGSNADTGEYKILIQEDKGDSKESANNTTAGAVVLEPGILQKLSLHHDEDADWFKFTANVTNVYSFETASTGSDNDADTVLSFYESDGVTLVDAPYSQDDNSGTNGYSKISSWTAPDSNIYYLKVEATGSDVLGDYSILVQIDSGWFYYTVDTTNDTGRYTSIKLGSGDLPHISFFSQTLYGLKHASFDGSAWTVTTVDENGGVGEFSSIGLDSLGNPRISYFNNSLSKLQLAKWDGSAWSIEVADSNGQVGSYTSLAIDSMNRLHIASWAPVNDDLRYALYNGTSWSTSTVQSSGEAGKYTSIAVDSSNNPHICYQISNDRIRYAKWTGSSWSFSYPDGNGTGKGTSIAIDSNNKPHVSYFAQGTNTLKYAFFNGTSWAVETVDATAQVGQHNSIALDSLGQPHISYYDQTNKDLKYAYKSGTWHVISLDTVIDSGEFSAIDLDSQDHPHISYFDATNKDLKYVYYK